MLGGNISVTSQVGIGTTFKVTIPVMPNASLAVAA
jgi:signal transduction histidine kinase